MSTHPLTHQGRPAARAQHPRGRAAPVLIARKQRRRWLLVGVVAVAVLAVVVALVVTWGSSSSTKTSSATTAAATLASIPPQTLAAALAANPGATGPVAITAPMLTTGGKPLVLYVGAEYCPFCASQRWAVITALSQFGQFSNLKATRSGAEDVYPNTPTFSFHGATYSSPFLVFQGVELQSNVRLGNTYATLDTMTAQQSQLLQTYDAPPYVGANSAGSIPWVDYAGKYTSSGSSFPPGLLAGKTLNQISAAVKDPNSAIGKAVTGAAGAITNRLCELTGGEPASVCDAFVPVGAASP